MDRNNNQGPQGPQALSIEMLHAHGLLSRRIVRACCHLGGVLHSLLAQLGTKLLVCYWTEAKHVRVVGNSDQRQKIVWTTCAEEGIDVSSSSFVVRFSFLETNKSHAQGNEPPQKTECAPPLCMFTWTPLFRHEAIPQIRHEAIPELRHEASRTRWMHSRMS